MLKKLYEQYREIVDYLFWGGVAFVLSMVLYWIFTSPMGWNEVLGNTVDWVICVLFTYVTNRVFVFKSKTTGIKGIGKEFVQFVLARLFTLILEDIVIFVGCNLMGYDTGLASMVVKFIGQAVVIITNYILSKLIIFRKKNTGENKPEIEETE